MFDPFSLSGKKILVTGASSGIGRAIAVICSKMGAQVVVGGRDQQRLAETVSLLEGGGHSAWMADLNDKSEMAFAFADLDRLDGLVHSAGIMQTLPFQFVGRKAIEEVMSVNFEAPAAVSAALVKQKILGKGSSIVFVSSVAGVYCAGVGGSVYAASKGAVNGLVKGMALDLAPKGIRVNSVNPGMIETGIFDRGIITPEQLEEDKKRYPLKRFGKPEEVAMAVVYLLSDASSWTTGTALKVDGGFTLQ